MDLNLQGEIQGAEKLLKKLDSVSIPRANQEWVKKATITIQGRAREEAPIDKGALRASIRYKNFKDYGLVYTKLPYAYFVHEGTKPHVIKIKKKKVLSDGKAIFGRQVQHPGTKPNRYFNRALDGTSAKIKDIYLRILNKFISAAMG